MTANDGTQPLSSLLDTLSAESRDHYLAVLLLPDPVQRLAASLYRYHLDLTALSHQVAEPMAGAIRLRWWAEVFHGDRTAEAVANPLASTLLSELESHDLPGQFLAAKAEAHEFDLFAEPMENRAMLEGYAGATRSVLFQLIGSAMAGKSVDALPDAAGHAGVSTTILAFLFDLERTRGRGQVVVPQDLLRASGLSDKDYLSADNAALKPVLEAMIDMAFEHHEKAKSAVLRLPKEVQKAFALCALTRPYLERMSEDVRKGIWNPQALGALRRQWLMWRGRL